MNIKNIIGLYTSIVMFFDKAIAKTNSRNYGLSNAGYSS
jgi:hypothetical protein